MSVFFSRFTNSPYTGKQHNETETQSTVCSTVIRTVMLSSIAWCWIIWYMLYRRRVVHLVCRWWWWASEIIGSHFHVNVLPVPQLLSTTTNSLSNQFPSISPSAYSMSLLYNCVSYIEKRHNKKGLGYIVSFVYFPTLFTLNDGKRGEIREEGREESGGIYFVFFLFLLQRESINPPTAVAFRAIYGIIEDPPLCICSNVYTSM